MTERDANDYSSKDDANSESSARSRRGDESRTEKSKASSRGRSAGVTESTGSRSPSSSESNGRAFTPSVPGYRSEGRDYRNPDYRGLDYRGIDPVSEGNDAQINWASALWRYRYALILPTLLGILLGGAYFTTLPNIYRSTARLIVESESPWTPGHESLEAVRTIPPAEMLLMQLRSEQVLDYAAKHPLMADAAAKMDLGQLRSVLSSGVGFQNAMQTSHSDRVVPFFLNFDDQDPQLTVNAVTALSDGLQKFFEERSETSIAELKKLITTAKDKLLPELNSLEAEYRTFRENSELSWDKTGAMINPYREKQLSLQSRRLELEDDQRELTTKMTAIESTVKSSNDPLVVMEVVQQLLGQELFAAKELMSEPSERVAGISPVGRDEDLMLAKLTIERTLLPLEIERQQFASQFGTGHPSVRQLDQQILATREKLNELTAQENERLVQLRREGETPSDEIQKQQAKRAQLAVSGFLRALETRRTVTESQMAQLDTQISALSDQAAKLARAESENAMYIRRIERAQKLFDSVEEQMSKISLSDQDASIHVTQLNAPTPPSLIAPILSRYLAMGAVWGGLAGLGLVYLLESQAKTYRSSDEISKLLALRVLTHVPTDTHRLPKLNKGEVYAYANIDPGLSAVHRPRSATAESIRRLRTAVFFDANAIGAKVIQVTSPLPEDGKSTLAANLAISMARSGKRVVIVDADMRRPQMTASFNMQQKSGLTDLINGGFDPTQVIHSTVVENLSIVPCGPVPANPAEALSMYQFADFLNWLRERFDYVIVDTPPLLIVTDPSIVASAVDGIVFTFRVRRGCRPQTKEAVAMLRATGTPIFGCVVNRVDQQTASMGYQGYQASSYYGRKYSKYSTDNAISIKADPSREVVFSSSSNEALVPADSKGG